MVRKPHYVVLGATGGIGSELCRKLRASGANVTGVGGDPDKVHALAEECGVRPFVLDATDSGQVAACLADSEEAWAQVDGIATSVGSLLLKPAHLTTEADWNTTLATNLTSAFAAVHAGVTSMMKVGGLVVLVSSAAARVGLANHEAIAAAKAGIIGLILSAAATYADRGIRLNCVAPGLVQTTLTARLPAHEASKKAYSAMHPLGRLGEPGDAASAIAWLLDPQQSWITGQVIGIDCGLATLRVRAKS
jgi:NAD(P)-dependent dehydrogenase (short-subunit alcohol dehydrogenase family)